MARLFGAWIQRRGEACLVGAGGRVLLGLAWCAWGGNVGVCGADWRTEPGYRYLDLPVVGESRVGFTRLMEEATGIGFTNRLAAERSITNQIYLNGSGVACGDVDGDGWCDVYFCGLDGPNALYRNLGNWRFEEIAEAAGVDCAGVDATGAVFGDLDGDGDPDLVVNTVGSGTLLFYNDGRGRFRPGPVLNRGRGGTSVALADVDGDGDLDLYMANYRTTTVRDMPNTQFRLNMVGGKPVVARVNDRPVTDPDLEGRFSFDLSGKYVEYGEPSVLYRNDGGCEFTAVPFTGGGFLDEEGKALGVPPYDWSLTALLRDLNGDGAPDLYVCNDFSTPDRLWLNDGHGRFRAAPRLALRTTSLFSMGVAVADVNRDGHDELFVSDMVSRFHELRMVQTGDVPRTVLEVGRIDDRPQYSHNTLLVNRGDGTYAELAQFSGVEASEWTWCPLFLDVDLDGYEDLLVTTGHERDAMNGDLIERMEAEKRGRKLTAVEQLNLRRQFPRLAIENVAFRNRGDLTFEEVGRAWGYATAGVSQGQALADLDNDGDLDVVVNNLNEAAGVYRNEATAPRLAVRLEGAGLNTRGIGARLRVVGGPVVQTAEIIGGGHYLSGSDSQAVFAAGTTNAFLDIEVRWRDGRRTVVSGVRGNRRYEISEKVSSGGSSSVASEVVGSPGRAKAGEMPEDSGFREGKDRAEGPYFEDVSARLGHRHHEENFDDFARQPLLPRKLSQLGPGVAWYDLNGDGWEDLVIASGRGGRPAFLVNDGRGGFTPLSVPEGGGVEARDGTAVVGLTRDSGQPTVLVGSANYEDGLATGPVAWQFDWGPGGRGLALGGRLPGQESSTGPLAVADYDGDGDLDLFVGGRCIGGRYPEAASSLLFRRGKAGWELDADGTMKLARIGLVSGAVWSDLDNDGWSELVLACEWGPIRVFRNRHGELLEATRALGLEKITGWWTGVATGDLDGDGRMDLVVGNWGLNHRWRQVSAAHPRRLCFGDLQERGGVDVLDAGFDVGLGLEVPERGYRPVREALPFVAELLASHAAYGRASIHDVLGGRSAKAGWVEANTLVSMVFFNRGERFEAVPLPAEAQWAPAFGVCMADMDGDGDEDVFLSQNFFAVTPDDWRMDAGRGLWLRGDGHGGLVPVPGQVSGVTVYGEQRGCAVADYDGDGRLDLVVTQNGNATRLFRNVGAKPGLRVRLAGPPGNPNGVGASLRLSLGRGEGPRREVQAGSGYWSQNGAVQVFAGSDGPARIEVRWPGGKTVTGGVLAGAREIRVTWDGRIEGVR